MRICILTPRFPFPENGGDVLRINNIARYLKSQNHELILLSFTQGTPPMKQAYELYDRIYTTPQNKLHGLFFAGLNMLGRRPLQCGYYHSWKIQKLLRNIIQTEQPHIFISHLVRMAPYLDNSITYSHTIIEMTDALSKTYGQSAQSSRLTLKRIIYSIEYKLIKRYEQYIIRRFPKVVLVSNDDLDYLKKEIDSANSLCCLTNGILPASTPSTIYNPNKICFIGNMRTLQNQDAAIFFAEEVLPAIVKVNPKTIFYIVGAEPPIRIRQLAQNRHIVVTDYVRNVEDVISDACLSVAPVRIAAGIQNKVLISMGQRIPTILTSLIAKAIPELKDGTNCLIRDKHKDIAEACLQLMTNHELRETIAENGYQMIKKDYNWNDKLNGYELL